MYEKYYQFSGDPFRLLPDPAVCLLHASCAHAWSYLQYAVKRGEGIVVVSGVPGSGKTTLAERLLREINGAQTVGVRLVAHSTEPSVVLRNLAHAFGLEIDQLDDTQLEFRLERYLIELAHSHRRALVIIDEAHTLSSESLEVLRLLTDLQSNSTPVMQLFLLGDEELAMMMSAPRMAQIQQRVIASCRLHPMSPSETKAYLEYRLTLVHWRGVPALDGSAVAAIHRHSGGLPRQINKICSRLFLYASAEEKRALSEGDVQAVVDDFRDELLEVFTGAVDEPASDRRIDDAEVRHLALVPPQSNAVRRPPRPDVAARDAGRTQVAERQGSGTQHPAARNTSATAAHPSIVRISHGTGQPSSRPGRHKHVIASLRRSLFGHASLMSAARSLGVEVSRRARSMSAMGRRSAATARDRAKQLLGDRFSALGQSTARSLLLARQQLRALARMRPSVQLRQEIARLRQRLHGKQGALIAVAGIALMSLAATLVLQSPEPRPRELPPSLAQPVADPPAGVVSTAARAAKTEPTVDPDPAQLQTAPMPGDRPPFAERSADGDRGATGHPAALAATLDESRHSPDVVDQSTVVAPSAEGVVSTMDDNMIETIELSDSTPGQAAGILPVAEIGESVELVARGDPSAVLPAPAAGQPRSHLAAAYPVTERDPVALMPVRPSEHSPSDAAPRTDTDNVASLQSPEEGNIALDRALESASTPAGSAESLPDITSEIAHWLELAYAALQRDRLLFPESNSAVGYFTRILEQDAEHTEALAGMEQIVERYLTLASTAFERGEFERADRLVDRAVRVSPNHTGSLELRRQIADTRAEQLAEAERQRQAEAAHRAAEAAARAEAAKLAAEAAAAREAELARQRGSMDELLWLN